MVVNAMIDQLLQQDGDEAEDQEGEKDEQQGEGDGKEDKKK